MGSSQLSTKKVAEQVRTQTDRWVDMRVQWVLQNDRGVIVPDSEVLLDVGGRWDTLTKQWDGIGESALRIGLHGGQVEAARWLKRWCDARANGAPLTDDGRKIYSLLYEGGRRGGKTDLAAKFGSTLFPILCPNTFSWLISETESKTEELEIDVTKWLPENWYSYLGAPHYTFSLVNGSTIWLRSAHKPSTLKRGRCDLAVLNEAQLMAKQTFAVVRGATTDTGGLTILAANPPDGPIGYWVEDYRDEALAGKRHAKVFHFDSKRNPHVDIESLEAMKEDLDERTYRREVLGEFLPREDVVFYTWSDARDGNVRPAPAPELNLNVTRSFLRRFFGRDFDCVLGMDFQRVPYPCAVELQAFRDVEELDPKAEPLIWVMDETIVEEGDEEALSAALIEKGYDPKTTAVIADSSGAFQGIDRDVQRTSFEIFRALGWPHVYRADANMKKNPDVVERVKVGNSLFKNATGKRRLFSAPENLRTNKALKLWENRGGIPYRKSVYAHLCDAVTYPLWHFYPRTKPKRKGGIEAIQAFPIERSPRGPRII